MKVFEVLGTGCKKCEKCAEEIRATVEEVGVEADVHKVTDPEALMRYQVMSTPGIVLDGEVVHTGSVPDRAMIRAWLGA